MDTWVKLHLDVAHHRHHHRRGVGSREARAHPKATTVGRHVVEERRGGTGRTEKGSRTTCGWTDVSVTIQHVTRHLGDALETIRTQGCAAVPTRNHHQHVARIHQLQQVKETTARSSFAVVVAVRCVTARGQRDAIREYVVRRNTDLAIRAQSVQRRRDAIGIGELHQVRLKRRSTIRQRFARVPQIRGVFRRTRASRLHKRVRLIRGNGWLRRVRTRRHVVDVEPLVLAFSDPFDDLEQARLAFPSVHGIVQG
mmetsp:Transcript_10589/g.65183  ORF Transcript_10589/g.65183 Transcript_10589/m.65183 type:complete len:254 (-) Transcript_10589:687-1448(-)